MSECSHRQKPPRPRHTRNLNAILHAAYQVFRERGRAAATLAEVAALSGVAEDGIRHYFSDIDALLAAVIGRWCDRLLGDARHRLESIESPRERLQLLLQCYLDAIRREPQFCGRMLGEAGPRLLFDRRYTQLLGEVISQGIAQSRFRSELPASRCCEQVIAAIEQALPKALGQLSALEPRAVAGKIVAGLCAADEQGAPPPGRPSASTITRMSA
jgi:AcrR family transcriptional regulator